MADHGHTTEGNAFLNGTDLVLTGQSKSSADIFLDYQDIDVAEKDRYFLICNRCKCKVMRLQYGSMADKELFMPSMTEKYKIGTNPTGETLNQFWLVKDMYQFENIGFSKNISEGTLKYLLCADCEIGPIGWHDTNNKDEFYIAVKRVKYGLA